MRITLALGGGTARGWAHIGVLSVLSEEGVEVGAVAGTSIGSLAAICLAASRLDVLEAVARGARPMHMLGWLDPAFARGALLGRRRIAGELDRNFGPLRFEDLPIPSAAVTADLRTGEEVALTSGPVVEAVLASMALPGLFPPLALGRRLLVDGALVANIPLAAARALGPGLPLVAVDLMGDYRGHAEALAARPSAVAIGRAAFLMSIARQAEFQLALDPPAVAIRPAIGHISTGAFHRAEDLIGLGRAAALSAMPAIKAACSAQISGSD